MGSYFKMQSLINKNNLYFNALILKIIDFEIMNKGSGNTKYNFLV